MSSQQDLSQTNCTYHNSHQSLAGKKKQPNQSGGWGKGVQPPALHPMSAPTVQSVNAVSADFTKFFVFFNSIEKLDCPLKGNIKNGKFLLHTLLCPVKKKKNHI